jgi:HSP20 family molecular chaperone IbpA
MRLAYNSVVMNAVIQSPTGSFAGLVPGKQNFLSRAAPMPRNAGWQNNSPSIQVTETPFEYKIVMPLSGIDPRKVFVFAMPRSIVIEVRFRRLTNHKMPMAAVLESIDERVVREFSLPVEIEPNATTCHISGESLVMNAPKAGQSQNTGRSRLIPLDTRV